MRKAGGNTTATDHVTETPEQPSSRPADAPRPLANHLAARLRELQARRGLTQGHVAKRLGCHGSALLRWESGSRFPVSSSTTSGRSVSRRGAAL
ncbi:MAG: ribosome-binding protein aMBF1 (putative translation factor) [Planctomycetota bacterium]|jgi:ribosome-binding protein aMBF1 (putative translation factor)